MATIEHPEVLLAQRLASNERPVRTKAVKKLRKYINVRSQKAESAFSCDELLKLWKGLFYCLWMQDKPLLQEDLSKQISCLIHSFHDLDGQLLYLECCLQTFKREWTGIDRLRMDKVYQLIRFMFRQTFEMLKRKNWQSSVVESFLELLTEQLLRSSSAAPSGLQFHILDIYMTELAAVGSAELSADQNLIFIEPFCKTAAKTKDRTLFRAICSSIFSTIIEQAPFAIEDLMREIKAAGDSDSSQDSDADSDGHRLKEKPSDSLSKKGRGPQLNGSTLNEQQDEGDEEDGDSDFGHLDDSDTELPRDDDVGPVLQFDYAALADRLFQLASRSSTSSHNRQKLYRIIRVLRNLSEGIFPQNEFPEEVSTDEDDDMFASRKRMKRTKRHVEEDEEGAPAAKKGKGKRKDASALKKQREDDEGDHDTTGEEKKKKRKKKKKKKAAAGQDEGGAETSEQGQSLTNGTEAESRSSVSSAAPQAPPNALPPPAELLTRGSVMEPEPCSTDTPSNKKKKSNKPKAEVPAMEPQTPATGEPVSVKKKKMRRKSLSAETHTEAEAVSCEAPRENSTTPAERKKRPKAERGKQKEEEEEREGNEGADAPPLKKTRAANQRAFTAKAEPAATPTPLPRGAEKLLFEITMTTPAETHSGADAELPLDEPDVAPPSLRKKKKKKKIPVVFEFEAEELQAAAAGGGAGQTKSKKKAKTSPSDFITFQGGAAAPTPLFCKTKRGSVVGRKKSRTPAAESKKVTFGLKNNKTAEFKKSDRSLLLSPDGSSRVPFDPQQKPKFGVLKSPPTPFPKRTSVKTPRRRPSAADFF